ncbi:hypothetical protein LCM00_12360 [Bacillus infantis]|uniref:hypothetical protein n=1 Tax=Bacillus infantis TaxID=324767 RepID=UPI001CD745A9|nr:hypothetical protein [Bacillus infantis]MCA1040297.1 hypothetical protein [Bacillus infantis]
MGINLGIFEEMLLEWRREQAIWEVVFWNFEEIMPVSAIIIPDLLIIMPVSAIIIPYSIYSQINQLSPASGQHKTRSQSPARYRLALLHPI